MLYTVAGYAIAFYFACSVPLHALCHPRSCQKNADTQSSPTVTSWVTLPKESLRLQGHHKFRGQNYALTLRLGIFVCPWFFLASACHRMLSDSFHPSKPLLPLPPPLTDPQPSSPTPPALFHPP